MFDRVAVVRQSESQSESDLVRIKGCKHVFHDKCLAEWMATSLQLKMRGDEQEQDGAGAGTSSSPVTVNTPPAAATTAATTIFTSGHQP